MQLQNACNVNLFESSKLQLECTISSLSNGAYLATSMHNSHKDALAQFNSYIRMVVMHVLLVGSSYSSCRPILFPLIGCDC